MHAPLNIPGVTFVREIGRGAFTAVYLAETKGKQVVVKIPDAHYLQSGRAMADFLFEAGVLGRCSDLTLPSIWEVGEVDDTPYLILEYFKGDNLNVKLENGPLPQSQVVSLAQDLCHALSEVHKWGMVHRDIKPSNVIVSPRGSAALIDFGMALRSSQRVDAYQTAGTFLYSSPEQVGVFNRPVDARSDLYSLGIVLYECIAGRPPYLAANAGEVIHLHATAQIPDLLSIQPRLSRPLAHLISKLMAKDPDDRFQSAAAVSESLFCN